MDRSISDALGEASVSQLFSGGMIVEDAGLTQNDLGTIGKACSEGRLPAPLGRKETADRILESHPALNDRLARSSATSKNSCLSAALGVGLPSELNSIILLLDHWNKRESGEEKHQDAVRLVEGFGEVNIHTAMVLRQYRDTGKFKMCKCPKCTQFFSTAG